MECYKLNPTPKTIEGRYKIFKIKDLGELRYFLGIEFARSEKGIVMHQRKYSLEIILETGLSASKPSYTPLDPNIKLTTKEYDDVVNKNSDDLLFTDIGKYKRLIGKLLYLTATRPDISFVVQTWSQFKINIRNLTGMLP